MSDIVDVMAPPARPSETAPSAGDPVLLERLTQNLVENAVRHNVPGGWVSVHTGASGGTVTLEVANSGPVVPPYEVESLFQPFRRLENGPSGERGLGLSIVRAIARAHDGDAVAAARPSGGLTVTVSLPADHPAGG